MVKISSEKLIENIKKENLSLNALLLFGNEEGRILGLIKTIYNLLKKNYKISEILYLNYKDNKNISIKDLINTRSFFSKNHSLLL